MDSALMPKLVCPESLSPLVPRNGKLTTEDGQHSYSLINGIPVCLYPAQPVGDDARWQSYYDWFSPFYDASERVLGKVITGVDVVAARSEIAAAIPACLSQAVLEVSPGPAIYQSAIAQCVGSAGHITALDISLGMLRQCQHQTQQQIPQPRLVCGNAAYLPFPTHSFDGLFHFGGVNLFSDPSRALSEFARVVKPDGWVIYGDEQFSTRWRSRNDWRAKILRRLNPGYDLTPPDTPSSLECLSEREVFAGLGYLRICRVINAFHG